MVVLNLDNAETRRTVESCFRTHKTLINPLIDWDDDFLRYYIKSEHININPLYSCGKCRVGCIGCPMAGDGRWAEFERYPKYKAAYIRAFERMLIEREKRGLKNGIKWKDGQYRRLAEYFVKYSEKTMKTREGFTGRRYNSSKNLVIPEPQKKTVSSRNAFNHIVKVPSGWYLDKDSIREAWHEVTGFMYFTYTLIYDGRYRKQDESESYLLSLETGEVEITEKLQKAAGRKKG